MSLKLEISMLIFPLQFRKSFQCRKCFASRLGNRRTENRKGRTEFPTRRLERKKKKKKRELELERARNFRAPRLAGLIESGLNLAELLSFVQASCEL